jgi:hypothetical protein
MEQQQMQTTISQLSSVGPRMRSCLCQAILASLAVLVSGTSLAANPACQPTLTIKDVSYSNFSPATNLKRYWKANIVVDASRCASASGLFALGFLRAAENAPDLKFLEPFVWHAGETKVRVEFSADEAVESYWIAEVASCRCRNQ